MVKRAPAVIGIGHLQRQLKLYAAVLGRGPELVEVLMAGGEEIQDSIWQHLLDQDLYDTGALFESVEVVEINDHQVNVQTDRPYAAAQEFGVTVEITPRQRRFFWAKWAEEGDEMWKALALSETYTIPAKPYWRPGVDNGKRGASKAMAKKVLQILVKRLLPLPSFLKE